MELKANKLAHIRYTRETSIGGIKGEIKERVIVPTYVPGDTIKAIDVSDLDALQAMEIRILTEEYGAYVQSKTNTIFSFEDWLDHIGQSKIDLKWRTFKLSNTKVIKVED
jgi:hypothetical protein